LSFALNRIPSAPNLAHKHRRLESRTCKRGERQFPEGARGELDLNFIRSLAK
jgi:hypothetical protein